MNKGLASLLAAATLAGCAKTPEEVSPYPARTVAGTVVDVRTGAVSGARVLVWNDYDTGSATTAADGTFSVTVDGSDDPSYWRVTKDDVRTREGTIAVGADGVSGWSVGIVSKDEILFSTWAGDVHMVRAGGDGTSIAVATTADTETTPCFASNDGLSVRWADTTSRTVIHAAWDGSGATTVHTVASDYSLLGIACGERGTLVERIRSADATNDVVIADDPPGATFQYTWPGMTPSFSPPAFGSIGPEPIEGNMAAFAEGDGIYTAFPYFGDTFLVPEKVAGTQPGDVFPRWSPFREAGTLHLGLQRNYRIYLSEVTTADHANVYSPPAGLFGGTTGAEARVTDFAWAPEIAGQDDRIALVDSPLGSTGDIVVIAFDPSTRTITSGPTVVYDANGAGNVGKAARVGWR
jgi:hypothetical protein